MDYAKEGLICIDKKGIITHINSVAMQILKHHKEVLNQPINEVLSNFPLDEILEEKKLMKNMNWLYKEAKNL